MSLQAEGEAAYADVQHAHTTTPGTADRQQQGSSTSAGGGGGIIGTPGPATRLSAAHIATTPSHPAAAASSSGGGGGGVGAGAAGAGAAMRTPAAADVITRALLSQAETPVSAAAQLSAQLAVSPSVLTPGVAQAMAEAGEAVAAAAAAQGGGGVGGSGSGGQQESTANLDKIKAKLGVLKQHIQAKTRRMSGEKRAQIEAQIEKLEKSLAYVEKQRVSVG